MIQTLLIANRGEIACRVIRTARRMGIRTIAVYSDADAQAMHVTMADEAVHIGPPAAAQSYLRADAIIEAARRFGADAIHPGYGFLSENAQFARDCAQAGLCFVGPPIEAIEAMGSKRAALQLMAAHDVPVLPGYHGEQQDDQALLDAAQRVGFPLIIKPSAGGGGKGMQVAHDIDELRNLLPATRRVALAAFADETLLLERYLHSHYTGQKRFSLEGGDVLIPLLDELVQAAGACGVTDVVVGKHLDLDVARAVQIALQQQGLIGEGRQRDAARRG
jgi:3-methylcrotonyl-CoA carboxylase alpha subunit